MFECVPGYFLVGAEVITCGENNDWVPPKPTCQKSKTFSKIPFSLVCEGVLAKIEHRGVLLISWVKAGEKVWNVVEYRKKYLIQRMRSVHSEESCSILLE